MSPPTASPAWHCATCGSAHDGLAMVFGPSAPDLWASASDVQRAAGEINLDMCILPLNDGTHYFVRGELQLPVNDTPGQYFTWSVWVSLSAQSMETTVEHWQDPERASLPPMFGWLSNQLSPYAEPTSALPTHVHTRAPSMVPTIEVDPGRAHQLVREQVGGINLHRVAELNRMLMAG